MRIRQALGLVEAKGLATAIEAADAMCKSANVKLLGVEPARGGGMHTVKVLGDVGAVKAACAAGSAACAKGNGVFSVVVIARPSEGLRPILFNDRTKGLDLDLVKNELGESDWWKFGPNDQFHPTTGVKTPIDEEKKNS